MYAGVAQLVEQLTCNQQVVGSIPIASSISSEPCSHESIDEMRTRVSRLVPSGSTEHPLKNNPGGIPEWLKGADCKSAVFDFGGSNPPPSTISSEPSCRELAGKAITCVSRLVPVIARNILHNYNIAGWSSWQLVGLITRRSQVQVLSPQPTLV